jgi:hypothetical protein
MRSANRHRHAAAKAIADAAPFFNAPLSDQLGQLLRLTPERAKRFVLSLTSRGICSPRGFRLTAYLSKTFIEENVFIEDNGFMAITYLPDGDNV